MKRDAETGWVSADGVPPGITMEDEREFICRIDREALIGFANKHGDDLARENGVPNLNPDTVIGRPLWSFIVDLATQGCFRVLTGAGGE